MYLTMFSDGYVLSCLLCDQQEKCFEKLLGVMAVVCDPKSRTESIYSQSRNETHYPALLWINHALCSTTAGSHVKFCLLSLVLCLNKL